MAKALSSIRICDFTGQLAGAGATKWLAAFGADVIRVEDPVRQGTWDILRMMLPFVDVMISDYSSVYHDYLLLDRPLLFTPYDYEEFERQQGFLYDYFETLPGPAVYTFSEFCDELGAALNGEDRYSDRRAALTEKIHTYRDAESRRRVSDLVTKALQEA